MPSPVDWIALHLIPGLGPVSMRRLLGRFGSPEAVAFRASSAELQAAGARSSVAQLRDARRGLARRAEREWKQCGRLGVEVLSCHDPGYPPALAELPDAPVLLWVRGELAATAVRVAVVGSRAATAYGRRVATGLGAGLAARGIEVISGGAAGIDACSHRGCLEEGGRTVAVLGSGLARPYPEENRALFDEIAASGALVSEFPLECPPMAGHFPRRNRVVSGLSAAVVVVEASVRSGSLITAAHALDQGRDVLAVPGPVSSARSAGCHGLIRDGAKLVQNVGDIVDELPVGGPCLPRKNSLVEPVEAAPELDGLTTDEQSVLGMLDRIEPIHLDDLAERIEFPFGRLQSALFGLELRGAVEQTPGGYYLLRPQEES